MTSLADRGGEKEPVKGENGHARREVAPETEMGRNWLAAARSVAEAIDSVARASKAILAFWHSVGQALASDWHGDKWAGRGVTGGIGIGFALKDGFGLAPFAGHTSYSVGLASVLCSPLGIRFFDYLRRESDREETRVETRLAVVPDLEEQLVEHEVRRHELSSRAGPRLHPPLEQRPFVARVLTNTRALVSQEPGGVDISFLLVRAISGHRYKVVLTRGPVEDEFTAETIWTANQVLRGGDAFAALFAPFQYRHTVVTFSLGSCQYFLVALAGADLPDAAVLRVSAASTMLSALTVAKVEGDEIESLFEAGGLG